MISLALALKKLVAMITLFFPIAFSVELKLLFNQNDYKITKGIRYSSSMVFLDEKSLKNDKMSR